MLTYPEIDPVIFSIGFLKIRWYGLMYVIGFVIAWFLARRRSQQSWSVIRPEQVDDLIFYAMLGVIAGGRIGYVLFYGFEYLKDDPLYLFKITEGGMSFHGGLAGHAGDVPVCQEDQGFDACYLGLRGCLDAAWAVLRANR